MSFVSGIARDETRCFVPFIDPVDMTGLFPAGATMAEVNTEAAMHGLRYPLVIAPGATLREHLRVADYAPASARFGNYADNIPGMNWELPSGCAIRVGERVVKSTTGYDLLRFLLHTGERFGKASAYVLRLRPIGGECGCVRIHGSETSLAAFAAELRRSCWSHWLDVVDWVCAPEEAAFLEIGFDCMEGEAGLYEGYLDRLVAGHGLRLERHEPAELPALPAFTLKSTPDRALEHARWCLSDLGATVRANLVCGSVLVFADHPPPADWVSGQCAALASEGGHLLGLEASPLPSEQEKRWIQLLEEEWTTI